jgi:hypothetical protein
LGGAGAGNGNFTTGEIYTVDKTAPTAGSLVMPAVTSGSTSSTFTLVVSDNLAIDVSSLDGSDVRVVGPNGFSQLASLVGVNPAGDGTPRTVTYQITAPAGTWDAGDGGTYTVTLEAGQVSDTAGNLAAGAALGSFQVSLSFATFMPLLTAAPPPSLPDLVVDRIVPTRTGIQVVIRNRGQAPVTDPFWVDVYIDPSSPPTQVNQIWPMLAQQGLVWAVTAPALPLPAGGTLTLSVGDQYYRPSLSVFSGTLAAGTPIYAQVDSANTNTTYGAVLENHEQAGGAYNNISGPVAPSAAVSLSGATSVAVRPGDQADLPARPAPSAVLKEEPAYLRR